MRIGKMLLRFCSGILLIALFVGILPPNLLTVYAVTTEFDGGNVDYTVTFVDEDGKVLSSANYHYGDEIVVPDAPSKAQTTPIPMPLRVGIRKL